MIDVLIVDDHVLLTDSLGMILENHAELRIVGMAYDGLEAVEKAQALKPDVVLMDIKMPGLEGTDAARLIKNKCPSTKVAILTSLEDSTYVIDSLIKGADAYILKDTPPNQLIMLIQCIHWGYYILSDNAKQLIQTHLIHSSSLGGPGACPILQPVDLEIINYISQGKNNREIGKLLGFADGTIKNKISKLMEATEVDNRAQLVMYAIKNELI